MIVRAKGNVVLLSRIVSSLSWVAAFWFSTQLTYQPFAQLTLLQRVLRTALWVGGIALVALAGTWSSTALRRKSKETAP
jgi:hypothetical protein